MRGVVLLLAAGYGQRLASDLPKALVQVGGRTLLSYCAKTIAKCTGVDGLVVAAPQGESQRVGAEISAVYSGDLKVVDGGQTRQESAFAALEAAGDHQAVLVHDAARPFASAALFEACLKELDDFDAVIPAVAVTDTLKGVQEAVVTETLDRSRVMAAQTPQGFRTPVYRQAHESASRDGFVGTDDASLVERLGVEVRVIPGHEHNMKITTPEDLKRAEMMAR